MNNALPYSQSLSLRRFAASMHALVVFVGSDCVRMQAPLAYWWCPSGMLRIFVYGPRAYRGAGGILVPSASEDRALYGPGVLHTQRHTCSHFIVVEITIYTHTQTHTLFIGTKHSCDANPYGYILIQFDFRLSLVGAFWSLFVEWAGGRGLGENLRRNGVYLLDLKKHTHKRSTCFYYYELYNQDTQSHHSFIDFSYSQMYYIYYRWWVSICLSCDSTKMWFILWYMADWNFITSWKSEYNIHILSVFQNVN